MSFSELVAVSDAVRTTSKRSEKVSLLAEYLSALAPGALFLAVHYLSGQIRQRAIGIGWAALKAQPPAASEPTLGLEDLDTHLESILAMRGEGSQDERSRALADLFGQLTVDEQEFLQALLLDNIRQGALAGVMADGVAKAAGVPAASVRRAAMLSGNLGKVAVDARTHGAAALEAYGLTIFRPIQPMLAKTAQTPSEAVEALGSVIVDVKLDGIRVQVHKLGDEVRVYTRSLREIAAPAIVRAVASLDEDALVLDGEAVGVNEAGAVLSFPETMGNFDIAEGDTPAHLTVRFFDIIHAGGEDLFDMPMGERLRVLDRAVPEDLRVDRIETDDVAVAEEFFQQAVSAGAEGVMVKDRSATYAAGRRGAAWRKVKPVHTLDLVVLAVEWGSGRRTGTLSNIHLGARNGDEFVMLGKTFKGMTDEMLHWQTERFLSLETHREGHVVHVRPEQVVEIAIDGVLPSPRYPGGVSLRFARVKQYRNDKRASDADTLETVKAFLG